MTEEPYLKPENIKIRQLVHDYRMGRIVVPEFQREYVWKPAKAPKLIDSIYRDFPIASLLLWQSAERPRARGAEGRGPHGSSTNWLIDGQQRVITLARTLSGEGNLDVVFNPVSDQFSLANAATRKDSSWCSVAMLCDDESFRALRRDLGDGRAAKQSEARLEKVRRILDYEVPVVRMINHTFDQAVQAFTRINTLGVRLKKEDIDSARVAARHSGFIADEVVPYLEQLRRQGFSRLNVMHLFRACASIARPDGRDRTPLHELSEKEITQAWKQTKRGTDQALGLVRSQLGLVNMDILWSGALIVPLIVACDKMPVKERDAAGLIGWLALATLLHRYSGSSETALDQDLKACRQQDPVGALLGNLRQIRSKLSAEPEDFGGQVADRSALLAMYIACKNRGILDFQGGGTIVMQNAVDRHHILPRGQFPEKQRPMADNIANIAFISGSANRSINMSGPEVYLKSIRDEVLVSQCVPIAAELWSIERADKFWTERRKLLAAAFNDFIRKCFPQRRGVAT
jgi:hypothetical protein